ncbi:hypothetical protein J8273_7720 [Carpediemonas membranifera]|uniref:Transmembrane protein n=1 Tax=Carpediemonas membranifera TaxID=201153 RepID=A0A8J6DZG5_9EUKA|nr:hypothetical protein J8273_7720 [Carpediemonas membranifera]|eukprot:KAG9390371.1 hypothetical protein J8273_7720 [Carpediemonas membranifera]
MAEVQSDASPRTPRSGSDCSTFEMKGRFAVLVLALLTAVLCASSIAITDILSGSIVFPSESISLEPVEMNWTIGPDTSLLNVTDTLISVSVLVEDYISDSDDVFSVCGSLEGTTIANASNCIDASSYAARLAVYDTAHLPVHVYYKTSRVSAMSGFTIRYYSAINSTGECNRQTVLSSDATLLNRAIVISSENTVEGEPVYCNYVALATAGLDQVLDVIPSTQARAALYIAGNSTNKADFSFPGPPANFQDLKSFRTNTSAVIQFDVHIDSFTHADHDYSASIIFFAYMQFIFDDFEVTPRIFSFVDCNTTANVDAVCAITLNHPSGLVAGSAITYSNTTHFSSSSLNRVDLQTLHNSVRSVGPYVAARYYNGDASGVAILPVVSDGAAGWILGNWTDGFSIIDPTIGVSGAVFGVSRPCYDSTNPDLATSGYLPPHLVVSNANVPAVYTLDWSSDAVLREVYFSHSLNGNVVAIDIVESVAVISVCMVETYGLTYAAYIVSIEPDGAVVLGSFTMDDASEMTYVSTCDTNPVSVIIDSGGTDRVDVELGVPSRNLVKHVSCTATFEDGYVTALTQLGHAYQITGPAGFGTDLTLRQASDGSLESIVMAYGQMYFFDVTEGPDSTKVDAADFASYVRPNHVQTEFSSTESSSDGYIPSYTTLSSFTDPQFEVDGPRLVLIPTAVSPLGYPSYFSYPRYSECDLSFEESDSFFGSCKPCSFGQIRQYSSSDSTDSVCVDCLDSEYCPPLSLMHLDYKTLTDMRTSTQVNLTARDAQEFTDWVLDNTTSFTVGLTIVLFTVLILYALLACTVFIVKVCSSLIPVYATSSKLNPLVWPHLVYKDAILPVSRQIDFHPRLFVSYEARRSGKDGVYVSSRGTFIGGLCTPFVWIIWLYIAWYAVQFYLSYTEEPAVSSSGIKHDANAIVRATSVIWSQASNVEQNLYDAAIAQGVTMRVTLVGYDHLDCSGQCLESFESVGCYANGIVCSETVYTCDRLADAYDKSGNCTVTFQFKNVNVESDAAISLGFGNAYAMAIHSSVEHSKVNSGFMPDGNDADADAIVATYCTDEATANMCEPMRSTDIVFIDQATGGDTVIAGLVSRQLSVTPTLIRVQEEQSLRPSSLLRTKDRYRWSYVDVYQFGTVIGFERTTTADYIYGAGHPLVVTIDMTTNETNYLSRIRVASLSNTLLTFVLAIITLNRIATAVNSFRISVMYTFTPAVVKFCRKAYHVLMREEAEKKDVRVIDSRMNPLYPSAESDVTSL